MRKISAIFLVVLFLFNLFGYRIVLNYEQQQSDMRLEASLDKQDYNDADLITIKVPLSLPYVTNQQDFERVDGEITVNGKILKYVKRKITDGNLILLCLPNHDKMRIESAKDEFFRYANDLVQNTQPKKSNSTSLNLFKKLLSDYTIDTSDYTFAFQFDKEMYNLTSQLTFLPSSHHEIPEHPPQLV